MLNSFLLTCLRSVLGLLLLLVGVALIIIVYGFAFGNLLLFAVAIACSTERVSQWAENYIQSNAVEDADAAARRGMFL